MYGQILAPAANGAAIAFAGPPVPIAGSDGVNLRTLLTDATGALQVVIAGGGTLGADIQKWGSVSVTAAGAPADALTNAIVSPRILSLGTLWNGATWDRAPGNTSGAFVQGTKATGTAVGGNPVYVGGRDSSGNTQGIGVDNAGTVATTASFGSSDTSSNVVGGLYRNNGTFLALAVYPHAFNTTAWSRQRSAEVGNNVAATGILASAGYAQYLNNAGQPALTSANYAAVQLDPAGNLRTAPQRPATGDILDASLSHTATTAATTIITVPAGRTWVGYIFISCAVGIAAASTVAGQARGVISTAGTGPFPAAGNYFPVEAKCGANAATGTVGMSGNNSGAVIMTVTAPAGNSVTVQGTTTITGTAGAVDYSAIGNLQ